MTNQRAVTVYGGYGHTARFVVSEVRKRGWTAILAGRDPGKLQAAGALHCGVELRPASVEDAGGLDRALAGAAAVINCAGPFGLTVGPVVEAARRAGIPYLDITGEVEVAASTFERYASEPRITVLPAMGFFGGLGDLLATIAMEGLPAADEIAVAYALDSWKPTLGTRAAGQQSRQRRGGRRLVMSSATAELRTDAAPILNWTFPAPFGPQAVMAELATADCVTIRRHLEPARLSTYMAMAAMRDVLDPCTPPPTAVDADGRSSQAFLVEVVARSGGVERRAVASGRDIYAITGPIVVEATARVLAAGSRAPHGALAAGAAFDARQFLQALVPEHLVLDLPAHQRRPQ